MRICLIGGIFGRSSEYRAKIQQTPEIVLEEGLRKRGHDVTTHGHFDNVDFAAYDLVHVHHLSFGALMAATAEPRPPLIFTGHAFQAMALPRRAAYSYVLLNADASVVLSDAQAVWEDSYFPLAPGRRSVIPNGIDGATFAHRNPVPPRSDEPWRLLYVGQLAEIKRVDLLIQALSLLDSKLSLTLELVYHVDTEEARLRSEVERLNLSGVHFLGPRTPSDLATLYERCHMLVLASAAEALPSVISEALLVGRPVIATDVGGVRSQVGEFGRVVRPGQAETIAAGIWEVIEDYDRFAAGSLIASREAARRFSVRAMLDSHEQLYAACAAAPRGRARGAQALSRGGLHTAVDIGRRIRQRRLVGARSPGSAV